MRGGGCTQVQTSSQIAHASSRILAPGTYNLRDSNARHTRAPRSHTPSHGFWLQAHTTSGCRAVAPTLGMTISRIGFGKDAAVSLARFHRRRFLQPALLLQSARRRASARARYGVPFPVWRKAAGSVPHDAIGKHHPGHPSRLCGGHRAKSGS